MSSNKVLQTPLRDFTAGLVVFLVALPLCLGIALASGAPLLSGILSGIVGGIIVGILSQSHTSVSGPAAGLAAVVASQITSLGSFRAFLLAVVLAGLLQILLGILRAGSIAGFVPSSVIKGLLAAIGLILVLKQIPHLLGHDADPEGDLAFLQHDHANTFSELFHMVDHIHLGAAAIGIGAILLMVLWERNKLLKHSVIPAPLVVVLFGVALSQVFASIGGRWALELQNFVHVPTPSNWSEFFAFFQLPDFSQLKVPAIYLAGITLAAVASLETLLNLEAIDKIDPRQRISPPSKELLAQGVGNVVSGLIGGLPITSVIVRSSVNIGAGSLTKLSAIVHGFMLLFSVSFFPAWINAIPLSCLAAILLVTGLKLASPKLVRQIWSEGPQQFAPFFVTVGAIVLTDLLIGILIGLLISIGFILQSNLRRPIRRFVEKHLGGEVLRIELANQVSFLNRAVLLRTLDSVPMNGHVLLDAQNTDYLDPDVLGLLRDFREKAAPARGIQVSLLGFRDKYDLEDQTQYVDYSTRELQNQLSPQQVFQILKDGNERFRNGRRLTRDLGRQVRATSKGQHPLAVIVSCIDSRTPAELIFDLGVGDTFSVRLAGNIVSSEALGSIEYACAVANAKLVLVMGHTKCGAVGASIDLLAKSETAAQATGCQHLDSIVSTIQQSIKLDSKDKLKTMLASEKEIFANNVVRNNVVRMTQTILKDSRTLGRLHTAGKVEVVGCVYDVSTGEITFLTET